MTPLNPTLESLHSPVSEIGLGDKTIITASSINVQYNVCAAKVERNSTIDVNHATRTVYRHRVQAAAQCELTRADGLIRWWVSVMQAINSAVRSSVKHLNSAKNTNETDLNNFKAR